MSTITYATLPVDNFGSLMTWETYIRSRFREDFQPEVWRVVLCFEFLRLWERDRLLALFHHRIASAPEPRS